jgi:hypothetical protein
VRRWTLRLAGALLVGLAASAASAGGSSVTVTLKSGRLLLTKDATSSALAIRATAEPDAFVVEGLDGALVNGAASAAFSGVTRGFQIDLGGGSNRLLITARGPDEEIHDGIFPALSIVAGDADDVVALDRVQVPGKLSIDLGGGDDAIAAFLSSFAGPLRLLTGAGADALFVGFLVDVQGKLQVDLGAGDDVFVASHLVLAGKTRLSLGPGADGAGFTDLLAPLVMSIDGGLGFDVALDDGSAEVAAKRKAVEEVGVLENQEIYDLIESQPGFVSAQDLVNAHGGGLN